MTEQEKSLPTAPTAASAPDKAAREERHAAAPTLSELLREQAVEEDDAPGRAGFSLRKILGGDILTTAAVRRQIWLMLLVSVFLIAYIAEGYSYRKYVLEIDRLTVRLKDAKYRALSTKSELTEHTRQSRILELLRLNNDTLLRQTGRPPYIIEVPE